MLKTEIFEPTNKEDEHIDERTGVLSCVVCGDIATGRHYGTVACNGCKGFFRRTIRRSYKYACRFNGICKIDKHNRAVCRACRYNRCIKFGMKVDAVQNERDLIGKRPRAMSDPRTTLPSTSAPQSVILPNSEHKLSMSSYYGDSFTNTGSMSSSPQGSPVDVVDDQWDSPKALLDLLLKSEDKIKSLRETVIKETGKLEYTTKTDLPDGQATLNDIFHSLHSQLLLVIEWAKTLRPFAELSTEDQTILLKNFASQHIVLCVAYRSKDAPDSLKLINNHIISRPNSEDDSEYFYKKDCERVMDQMVAPMRFMQMDDVEFVAMKACVLFNPVAKGLSNESVMKVLETRRKIFAALENYVKNKVPQDPNRIGDLTFFILSPLQSLAKTISEDVLVTKLSGVARIDMLMEELILEDSDPKDNNCADNNLRRSLSENEYINRPLSVPSTPLSSTSSSMATSSPHISVITSNFNSPIESVPKNMPATMDQGRQPMDETPGPSNYEMLSNTPSYVIAPLAGNDSSPINNILLTTLASRFQANTSPVHQFTGTSLPSAWTPLLHRQVATDQRSPPSNRITPTLYSPDVQLNF
uniref:Uncharacterized protein n=1 Tax=Acrobeloides nanus TaxID=290746 RepID=A0A914C5D3_9BILA